MPDTSKDVLPRINDEYWFEFSKTLLDSSIARRDQAAGVLQQLVIWLWGIYTASAAVGFSLSDKQVDLWQATLTSCASGALILVYWGTVWVQMPQIVSFDPRSPTEINDAFSAIIRTKNRRLNLTLLASVGAAILVSMALILASIGKSSRHTLPTFHAVLGQDANGSIVSTTAKPGKTDVVELRITIPSKDKIEKPEVIIARLVPTEDGLIQTSTRLNSSVKAINVQLTWKTKDGTTVQLAKEVEEETSGSK